MRIIRIVAAAICLATPAAAQEPTLFDQYKAASAVFSGNAESPGDFQENEPARLLEDLEGDWFPIGLLLPSNNDTELFEQACTRLASRLVVRGAYAFDFTLRSGEDGEVTTTYSSRGGNAFGSYTDPEAWLHRLGLDRDTADISVVTNMLGKVNGTASLHRPSPDVLVIQTNYDAPQLFARCP